VFRASPLTYVTWTADNLLRHTVYVGLREDKPAAEVRREASRIHKAPREQGRRFARETANARSAATSRLSELSVVDHHFDQFGNLVPREVTRI
jgi:hypothetical protein